jgi:hypothetical protein
VNDLKKLDDLKSLREQLEENPLHVLDIAAKYLYVRGRDGKIDLIRPNAAQRKFEEQRGQQNIVLKARQMGLTTWVAGRFFLRTILYPGTLTVQVAHTQAAVEAIFRMVQRMWEHLPEPWRKGDLRRSRANVGQMVFPEIDSEFRVWSAADINAGRGLSMQNLHCSEVSRWPGDSAATLAGLRAALAPQGELVLESTPNGAYGAFYNEWRAAIDPTPFAAEIGQGFSPDITGSENNRALAPDSNNDPATQAALIRHFLPWWLEPAYVGGPIAEDRMTEAERALVEKHGLSKQQIGFRRGLERQYGKLRSQEFAEDAETCFRATGDCFFETEVIEQRMADAPEPYKRSRNGALLRWSLAQPGRNYLVAADPAGGGADGDFAAVQVIDMQTGRQVAELQQHLHPRDLTDVIVELAHEFNDALIAVERNNHGGTVVAFLEDRGLRKQMYPRKGEAGWVTDADSREKMLDRLNVLLSREPERFASQRFLGECRTFLYRANEKSSAAGGAHDDLVMAMAIAQAVREEKTGQW